MKKKWLILISLLLFTTTLCAHHANTNRDHQTIIFMRHAEKPLLDFGQLKCQGLNRALALPKKLLQTYGKPDYVFAPNPYFGGYFYYVRALVTIEPLVIQENSALNHQFAYYAVDATAQSLLAEKYHQSLIFVTWEHLNIVKIAKRIMENLGADESVIPSWPNDDYDSLYIFDIDWNNNKALVKFHVEKENLNNLPEACPLPKIKKLSANNDKHIETYVFVPDAETMPNFNKQLSCQGLNRALRLPALLNALYPDVNQFILPKPRNDLASYFLSALMTIEPTIISRGGNYIPGDYEALQQSLKLMHNATSFDRTVIITWPIEGIADLAQNLYADFGGNPQDIPNPLVDKNTFYEIKVAHRGFSAVPTFTIRSEQLNNPASICPGE